MTLKTKEILKIEIGRLNLRIMSNLDGGNTLSIFNEKTSRNVLKGAAIGAAAARC